MYLIEFRQSSICVNQDFLTQITSRDCLIHVSAGYIDFKKSKKTGSSAVDNRAESKSLKASCRHLDVKRQAGIYGIEES